MPKLIAIIIKMIKIDFILLNRATNSFSCYRKHTFSSKTKSFKNQLLFNCIYILSLLIKVQKEQDRYPILNEGFHLPVLKFCLPFKASTLIYIQPI